MRLARAGNAGLGCERVGGSGCAALAFSGGKSRQGKIAEAAGELLQGAPAGVKEGHGLRDFLVHEIH